MHHPYSVMSEPVIPVLLNDGQPAKLGIRDVLVHADRILDLQCASPLEQYAVFRLLVAITTDLTRPNRWLDRQALLENRSFSAADVDAYIADCEAEGPRFDLFDAHHPFMQAPFNPVSDEKAIKPVAGLSVSLPSGNNHIFLDHRPEDVPFMTPDEAFRALLTLYVFCTAAAQGYPSGVNNTPPVYSRILGHTLYESLILNMISTREHPGISDGYDKLPWRSDAPIIPKQEFVSIDFLEGLTWQPRRVTLFRDEDGYVRKVALQQGKNFKGNDLWRDPHVAYRLDKKNQWLSIKPQSGRSLWRDLGAMLADTANVSYRPPLTVSRAVDVLDLPSPVVLVHQVGVITNQASYVNWVEERLSVPACLLTDDLLASIIREDIEAAEYAQHLLAQSVTHQYSHDRKQTITLAEQARLAFLHEAHSILFSFCIPNILLLRDSLTPEALQMHFSHFFSALKQALLNVLRDVVQASGSSSRDLLLQAETQRELMNRFAQYVQEREERHG